MTEFLYGLAITVGIVFSIYLVCDAIRRMANDIIEHWWSCKSAYRQMGAESPSDAILSEIINMEPERQVEELKALKTTLRKAGVE